MIDELRCFGAAENPIFKCISVYLDKGVGSFSLRHLVKNLRRSVDLTRYSIKRMNAEAFQKEEWEEETALLIIPGGRDVFYNEKLKGGGAQRIGAYVRAGGRFIGICAGAYFGASEIEFEKGGPLEMCARRPLAFFPGRAVGPAYGSDKYRIDSEKGAEAVLIQWRERYHAFVYFNGGCFFEAPEQHSDVTVLGRYVELKGSPAAVVLCSVGKGRAILSGVHAEYLIENLSIDNPYFNDIIPKLEKTKEQGRRLFCEMLELSGI